MAAREIACVVALFALLPQLARAQSKSEMLDRLVRAYPDALAGHDDTTITWRDGTVMPVDDGVSDKRFDQLLRNASILDQMRKPYPSGPSAPPAVNVDPGRFRNDAFFRKMYGDCNTGEVRRNLVTISWLPRSWGKPVQVTRVNGIAERLTQVSAEIEALDPALRAAAFPIAGVLSCRAVADTGRMSMHGYAAAIDLNLKVSDYWLWAGKGQGKGEDKGEGTGKTVPYRNRMPREIVDIFERHGFIWGGKWYHYDTMHFEYRPELLDK